MTRALYVGAFVPAPQATHAGARVAHENLAQLRQRHGAVDVLVCTTEPGPHAHLAADAAVVQQRPAALLHFLATHVRTLGLQAVLAAPLIHTRLNGDAVRQLAALLGRHRYAEVFADFTQSVELVRQAVREAGVDAPPLTICLHDVFVQRMLRSRGALASALTGAVAREEQRLVLGAQQVLTLSAKDRDLVVSLFAVDQVAVKPFLPPAWCAEVHRAPGGRLPPRLAFFGNFDRPENSDAAAWFVGEVLPRVAAAVPDLSLQLIGTGSDRCAERLRDARVSGTGFVENPAPHFSRCALAIAPLLQGAGVKFKVLEALAAGVPVVGTPVACEGIAAQPLLVRAEPGQFADALITELQRRSAAPIASMP